MEPRGIRLPGDVWKLIDLEAERRKATAGQVVRDVVIAAFCVPGDAAKRSERATK